MARILSFGLLISLLSAAMVAQNLPDMPQQQINARVATPTSFHNSSPEEQAKVADRKWMLGAATTIASGILASTRSRNEGRAFAINMPIALTADLASYEFKKHYHKRLHGVLWILPSALADGYFAYQITNPGSPVKKPPIGPIAGCRTNCTQTGGSGSGSGGTTNGSGSGSGSGVSSGSGTGSGSGGSTNGSGSGSVSSAGSGSGSAGSGNGFGLGSGSGSASGSGSGVGSPSGGGSGSGAIGGSSTGSGLGSGSGSGSTGCHDNGNGDDCNGKGNGGTGPGKGSGPKGR